MTKKTQILQGENPDTVDASWLIRTYRQAVNNVPILKYSWVLIATVCILALAAYFKLNNEDVFLYALAVIAISFIAFIFSFLTKVKDVFIKVLLYILISCIVMVCSAAVLGFGSFIFWQKPEFYKRWFPDKTIPIIETANASSKNDTSSNSVRDSVSDNNIKDSPKLVQNHIPPKEKRTLNTKDENLGNNPVESSTPSRQLQNLLTSSNLTEVDLYWILSQISEITGLKINFKLLSSEEASELFGTTISSNFFATEKNGKKYLVYDFQFLYDRQKDAQNKWALVTMIAHESAHHFLGLSTTSKSAELDADEFAGFVLGKLGASLNDAKSLFLVTPDSERRPQKTTRIEAVQRGWYRAKS